MSNTAKHTCSKEVQEMVGSSLHQIRTRALRDAPVYLQHVSVAEDSLVYKIEALINEQIYQALERVKKKSVRGGVLTAGQRYTPTVPVEAINQIQSEYSREKE